MLHLSLSKNKKVMFKHILYDGNEVVKNRVKIPTKRRNHPRFDENPPLSQPFFIKNGDGKEIVAYFALPNETAPAVYAYAEVLDRHYGFDEKELKVSELLDYHSWEFVMGSHTVIIRTYGMGEQYGSEAEPGPFFAFFDQEIRRLNNL